uniref:Uncharacterized protein n=1 Tax=Kalanchoe fedtschenkoi TaxID=63787 RepID=A0A7N0TWY3_KALFE
MVDHRTEWRMARFIGRNKHAAVIWSTSAILFYALFLTARRLTFPSAPSNNRALYAQRRSILYGKMARDLDDHGPAFLKQGQTSQSTLSDIFQIEDGQVRPTLKPANPPVRANVLYLKPQFALNISEAVKDVFSPHFTNLIWFQNSSLYHFSMFHASHHITPVPATEQEINLEARAIQEVAEISCPLTIVLDRVVLTSTGVLLGCWQVISGTDPIEIRAALKAALPHAPEKQLYDTAILHTSFARILGHPASLKGLGETSEQLQFFHDLVNRLDKRLGGFEVYFYHKGSTWLAFQPLLSTVYCSLNSNLNCECCQ